MIKIITKTIDISKFLILQIFVFAVLTQKMPQLTNPYLLISIISTSIITSYLTKLPSVSISFRAIKFILMTIKDIAISSVKSLSIINDNKDYNSQICKISLPKKDHKNIDILMYAASITMVPGTTVLAVDQGNNCMYIQGLDESMLSSEFDKAVISTISGKLK